MWTGGILVWRTVMNNESNTKHERICEIKKEKKSYEEEKEERVNIKRHDADIKHFDKIIKLDVVFSFCSLIYYWKHIIIVIALSFKAISRRLPLKISICIICHGGH